MQYVTDQMGRSVSLSEHPQRIISLVPSQTELLYDLGLGDSVIGITKFCIHPENWCKEKTIIGGTKNFRFDVIDALQPDLILGNKEENYQEGINTLAQKYPVWMSDIYTLNDALQMINAAGSITRTHKKAKQLIQKIELNFENIPNFKGKKVAYFIWKKPYMVAANETFIHDMLEKIGLKNCFENKDRYVVTTAEEIKQLNPDFIFLSSEPYPFKVEDYNFFRNLLPQSSVRVVDGEAFSWYGSRLVHSPSYFKKLYDEKGC